MSVTAPVHEPPFTPSGRAAMDEFRALYREIVRRRLATAPPRTRLRAAVTNAAVPLVAAKATRRFVRDRSAAVHAAAGVPRWRQAVQFWWVRLRYNVRGPQFLDYQMYRPERRPLAGLYVGDTEHRAIAGFLYRHLEKRGAVARLHDKRTFDTWCAEHGLPATPVLAEWEDGALVVDRRPEGALPPRDLFSKPADLYHGFGTARWTYDGEDRWLGQDGRARSEAELVAELAELSRTLPALGYQVSRRILVMPRLFNHPALAPITTGTLCTVRIVTYRRPDGPAEFLVGTYKMASGDAPADNFHYGGIVAPVDPATGRLGQALRRVERVLVPVERHPDTGAPIAGFQLPFWAEAVALARRAHDAEPLVPAIGWDVALTPDGPVLLEANFISGADIMQAPSGRPLGTTPYVEALNAHIRAALAATRGA